MGYRVQYIQKGIEGAWGRVWDGVGRGVGWWGRAFEKCGEGYKVL